MQPLDLLTLSHWAICHFYLIPVDKFTNARHAPDMLHATAP